MDGHKPQQQKTSAPCVSVIMGVYNQRKKDLLIQGIYSILNQTISDIEFIIYDDGSEQEVKADLDEIAATDGRIRLIHARQNNGLGFALNTCIKQARGKYIARMDADDSSHPDRLEKQVRFLEDHPEYAWCGTNAKLYDGGGVWGARVMPAYPQDRDYLKYSPFIHPSVMYRADIFREHEGYQTVDETLRCEDYEIFMRLHRRGLRGANIQQELLLYRENRKSYQRRTARTRLNETKIRYRGFRDMGMLFPVGWIYVVRPLVAAVIPTPLIGWWKRKESSR